MAHPTIALPDDIRGLPLVLSISGGKDSTAAALALREAGLDFRMVFADTGWEAKETYEHLDYLRTVVGPIDTVGAPGGMVAKIKARAGFPARMQRWCTRELKLELLRKYHDDLEVSGGMETVCVVGVRAAESDARAKMPTLEDEPPGPRSWGGWVWRPLLSWTVEDVIRIHNAHGVRMNPLYLRGHDRVGCYPCIFARKEEIRLIAEYAPERIDEIRELEKYVTEERARRNAEKPDRYKHEVGTFFQGRQKLTPFDLMVDQRTNGPLLAGKMNIDNVVAWSKTKRGGRQLSLLAPVPEGGCMRWGLCETHGSEDDT